jgi:V/A-type H+-transporting ATPase subunit E
MNEQEQALTAQIVADARKQAASIKERAEADARKIVADAQQRAEKAVQGALKGAAARAARREEIAAAHIQQEIRKLRLQHRQELLDYARAEVQRRLARLAAGPEHRESLKNLALLAIESMDGDRFMLVLRAEDRRAVGERLAAELGVAAKQELGRAVEVALADEALEASGGLVVRSADGHQVADQTFDGRLNRLWEQIRAEVVAMLPDVGATA